MEKLKQSLTSVSSSFFNSDVFLERFVGSVGGISGATALFNRDTGLLVAPNKIGGYDVYLDDGNGFEIYANDLDVKTVSVCALLSYMEIFVENHLYQKFGSFDYLDSLDFKSRMGDSLTVAMDAINEAFLKMGVRDELLFHICEENRFDCLGMDFFYERINSFISGGDELYAWELADKKIGQVISADFKKYDSGILQSLLMAVEKKMFLLVGDEPVKGKIVNFKNSGDGLEP